MSIVGSLRLGARWRRRGSGADAPARARPPASGLPRLGRALRLCALAMGLGACSQAAEPPSAPTPSLTVETIAPRIGELTREVDASGSIAAWEEIGVGAEVPGLRVTEVTVEVGDTVRRGDVLVRLDARTLRARASQSQAAVAQAQANAAVAEKRAKRIRELAAQHFVSAQDADEAAGEALSANAQLRTMRSALDAAQVELDFTEIRAPHDGVISARNVQPGQVAGSDSELLKLIRDRRLEWRAELAEADLTRVAPGMPVRVSGPNGTTVEGRVRQVSPALDTRRRTGLVYADLPAPGPLRAGMFSSGSIALGRQAGLLIPLEAVVRRDGRAYAFVVDDKSRARERRIRTAAVDGAYVDVREGLRAGERVVASGAGLLGDGDLVRVAAPGSGAAPAAAATAN